MPSQVNAELVGITGTGTPDDWDRPAVAGVDKWAGTVPAYYRERVQRSVGADGLNIDTIRTLYVDTADLDGIGLSTDDTITFTAHGETMTGRAVAVARSALPGLPSSVQTTRIDLEPT